ncbi:MAG TPA: FISUMP domain-containing protein [Flavobacteriales bacterium]|nr:FISUMP domain-containing protein [Flavobacteriales bacterium]
MKSLRYLCSALVSLLPAAIWAQVIVITFEGTFQGSPIPLDSIHVENLTGSGDTTIYFPDNQLVLDFSTRVLDHIGDPALINSAPNPFGSSTEIMLVSTGGEMQLTVHDATGRVTAAMRLEAAPGQHRFRYSSGLPGLHIVSAEQNGQLRSLRVVAMEGTGSANGTLSHLGATSTPKAGRALFTWQPGDALRYIGYASNDTAMFSGVILHTPTTSTTRTFVFYGATCPESPTVADANGNVYPTVRIGDQCWMANNLRTTQYSDGSAIPNVTVNATWAQLNTGAWSYYENNVSNNATHGKLYNWFAATDPRGVCPIGWHVPTDAEWQLLESALGMPANELNGLGVRGEIQNVGGKVKATSLWNAPNAGATNESGFSGIPSGTREGFSDGTFFNLGNRGYWWSSSEGDQFNFARYRSLSYFNAGVGRYSYYKTSGYCIRCLRD